MENTNFYESRIYILVYYSRIKYSGNTITQWNTPSSSYVYGVHSFESNSFGKISEKYFQSANVTN